MKLDDFLVELGFKVTNPNEIARFEQQLEHLDKKATQMFSQFDGFFSMISKGAALLGGAFIIKEIAQTSDEMAMLDARFDNLLESQEKSAQFQRDLYDSAQKLGVAYNGIADGGARLIPPLLEAGRTSADALKLAEVQSITALMSGSSQSEAAASAIQFAQAMGSGVLQGDELKSILENNNTLARILAKNIGVSIGEIKKLGADGKLTSKQVMDALLQDYDLLIEKAKSLPVTFDRTWTRIKNAFSLAMGQINENGSFNGLLSALDDVSWAISDFVRNGSFMVWAENIGIAINFVLFALGFYVGFMEAMVDNVEYMWGLMTEFIKDHAVIISTTLGTLFVPMLLGAAPALLKMIKAFSAFSRFMTAMHLSIIIESSVAWAAARLSALKTVATWWMVGMRMAAAWLIGLGPIGLLIAAIVAIGVAIYVYWDKIKPLLMAFWNKINEVAQAFKDKFNEAIESAKAAFNRLSNWADGVWEKLKNGASIAADFIANMFKDTFVFKLGKFFVDASIKASEAMDGLDKKAPVNYKFPFPVQASNTRNTNVGQVNITVPKAADIAHAIAPILANNNDAQNRVGLYAPLA